MDKLKTMTKRRTEAHAELLSLDSKIYKAFLEMVRAAFSDGELSKRM